MSKFKFDAHTRIFNESLDIHFQLIGEIDVDFEPDDAPSDPCDEPDDPYDEPGEDDDPDWSDGDPDGLCWPPVYYN